MNEKMDLEQLKSVSGGADVSPNATINPGLCCYYYVCNQCGERPNVSKLVYEGEVCVECPVAHAEGCYAWGAEANSGHCQSCIYHLGSGVCAMR